MILEDWQDMDYELLQVLLLAEYWNSRYFDPDVNFVHGAKKGGD